MSNTSYLSSLIAELAVMEYHWKNMNDSAEKDYLLEGLHWQLNDIYEETNSIVKEVLS